VTDQNTSTPKASKGSSVPSRAKINAELSELLPGWEWDTRNGFYAAHIYTQDVDCIVEVIDGITLRISTGVAPIVIVQAVLKANKL
jgi:hypothetical protein